MPEKPIMTEKQTELFRLFKMAIESERSAQELYQEAIVLCDDSALKNIIAGFYNQEVQHEKFLLDKYKEYGERFAVEDDV